MGEQNLAVLQDRGNDRRCDPRVTDLSACRAAPGMLCSGEDGCCTALAAELMGFVPGQQLQGPSGQMEYILIEYIIQGAQRAEGHTGRFSRICRYFCCEAGCAGKQAEIECPDGGYRKLLQRFQLRDIWLFGSFCYQQLAGMEDEPVGSAAEFRVWRNGWKITLINRCSCFRHDTEPF
ncbi:hypothetical protein D3C81_1409220 [compost metagenome]